MHLSRRTYVKRWNHQPEEEKYSVDVKQGGKAVENIKPERISFVIEDMGYWRKANQIHKWMVDNVQGGKDDCEEYLVGFSKLVELHALCVKLLASKSDKEARELLPPAEGFFFGSTEIDDYYWEDLKLTVEILEPILRDGSGAANLYYSSSW